jgi:predicted dehydrogenase
MKHKQLGIAVVGAGRIGTLRATMVASHPAVKMLAVSDRDSTRATTLAEKLDANFVSSDNHAVISHPDVDAVIVSTSEPEHLLPVIQALECGKPVLVEKPIALRLEDADRMIETAQRTGTELRVGYTMRFNRRYLLTKEQIVQGRLGRVVGGTARLYNTRAHGMQILQRSLDATFVQDALTYLVDLFGWFLDGLQPVEVYARGHGLVYREAGYDADEVTWAVITFADGTVINLGVGYALPAKYPTHGRLVRVEVLGEHGVVILDEDHKENILYSETGYQHAYVPDHNLEMVFLTSNASGNLALGDYWGPLGDETRVWLDHLATGKPCPHTRAEAARQTLGITTAIEMSAHCGEAVKLPLAVAAKQ